MWMVLLIALVWVVHLAEELVWVLICFCEAFRWLSWVCLVDEQYRAMEREEEGGRKGNKWKLQNHERITFSLSGLD